MCALWWETSGLFRYSPLVRQLTLTYNKLVLLPEDLLRFSALNTTSDVWIDVRCDPCFGHGSPGAADRVLLLQQLLLLLLLLCVRASVSSR